MKRIKYNKLLIPGGLAVLALLFACGKNFLSKPPLGVLSPGIVATNAGVQGILIGAYSDLQVRVLRREEPGDLLQITGPMVVFAPMTHIKDPLPQIRVIL